MPTFDASTDRLLRTSGVLDHNSAYTVMCWIRPSSISGAPCIFAVSAGTYSANGEELYISASLGNRLTLYAVNGGTDGFGSPNGSVLSTGTWYHVAIVREGNTSLKSYLNGVLDSTCTVNIASRSASTRMEFGAWSSGNNDPFSGRVQYIKIWNVALTAAEVAQEVYSIAPRKLDSLWAWHPTRPGSGERAKDYSGNGRDLTEGGTLTDEDPPPISWGGRMARRYRAGANIYNQAVAGTLTTAGALTRRTGKTIAGTLTTAGALVKRTSRALAGTLSSSGAVTALRVFIKAIGGTLTAAGALTRRTGKTLAGTLTTAGTLARQTRKTIAGTLTSSGAVVKRTAKAIGGTLSSAGGVAISRLLAWLRHVLSISAPDYTSTAALGTTLTVPAVDRTSTAALATTLTIPAVVRSSSA